VFEFTNVDGKRARVVIPRDIAASAPKVRLEILRRNAALPAAQHEATTKVMAVIDAPPQRLFREAARTGWRDDLSAFVTPWGAIDSKKKPQPQASTSASREPSPAPRDGAGGRS
jgi:hypothetical protein